MAEQNRAAEFRAEISQMRQKTGKAGTEQVLQALGVIIMLVGVVLAIIGYFASTNTSNSLDQRELVILALLGLAVTIVGAVMFLRYSMARFLRFWLLRQIYENRREMGEMLGIDDDDDEDDDNDNDDD